MSSDSEERAPGLRSLASGFRKRTLKTARMASKVGVTMLKKTLLPASDDTEMMDEDVAMAAAEQLLNELDGMKGLVMKFGQMASYLNPNLPPRAQKLLGKLQSESQAMAYDVIAQTFVDDFGAEPDALFESFDHEPFAAASIGQVHRATYNGVEVAVKVQYPGVSDVLDSDLKTMGAIVRVAGVGSKLDTKGLVAELRDRVLEECDYEREARNQMTLRGLLLDEPDVRIPLVVPDRVSGRIITTEMADGLRFYPFIETANQAQRDAAGGAIYNASMRCIFGHGAYNADPHPGNYLFGEQVTLLDFGCVKYFSVPFLENWRRISKAILDGDRAVFRECYVEAGFVPNPDKFDWDFQWNVLQYLFEPSLTTKPYRITHEYVSKSYNLVVFKNPNRLRQALPPDWLFINRLQWGLNSVLAHLGSEVVWRDVMDRVLSEPMTPVLEPNPAPKPNPVPKPREAATIGQPKSKVEQ